MTMPEPDVKHADNVNGCATCVYAYFAEDEGSGEANADYALCRRHAPSPSHKWPIVKRKDWCGEYQKEWTSSTESAYEGRLIALTLAPRDLVALYTLPDHERKAKDLGYVEEVRKRVVAFGIYQSVGQDEWRSIDSTPHAMILDDYGHLVIASRHEVARVQTKVDGTKTYYALRLDRIEGDER